MFIAIQIMYVEAKKPVRRFDIVNWYQLYHANYSSLPAPCLNSALQP